jgi:hypothetical protein
VFAIVVLLMAQPSDVNVNSVIVIYLAHLQYFTVRENYDPGFCLLINTSCAIMLHGTKCVHVLVLIGTFLSGTPVVEYFVHAKLCCVSLLCYLQVFSGFPAC